MKNVSIIALLIGFCLTMYGMDNSTGIHLFVTQEAPTLKNFVEKEEYQIYDREDLEKIVKTMIVDNKQDINHRWNGSFWTRDDKNSECNENPTVKQKKRTTTALGCCIKKTGGDYTARILADILVSNGARLCESYNNKFGYYFAKKVMNWCQTAYDIAAPRTKLFEIMLYRRVQHCIQKSKHIYLITKALQNKGLRPIPKFVLDHIAHNIIADGVTDVISVCSEEVFSKRESIGSTSVFELWKHYFERKVFDLIPSKWRPTDLRPFDPQAWNNDFTEFMHKKRNKDWNARDSNLIIRALRYKTGSLYKDEEFKLKPY